MVEFGGNRRGVDRMLIGRAHISLLPSRAAVARAMDKTVVGDNRLRRITRCYREAKDYFAVTPTAVAALTGPAGDDVLIVSCVECVGPRSTGVGSFKNLWNTVGTAPSGVNRVEIVLSHCDGQKEVVGCVDARTIFKRVNADQVPVIVRAEVDPWIRRSRREAEKPHLAAHFSPGERKHEFAGRYSRGSSVGEGRAAIGRD